MRMLIVTEDFPPVTSSESFCTWKFVVAMCNRGHSISLLMPDNEATSGCGDQLPDNCNIIKVKGLEPQDNGAFLNFAGIHKWQNAAIEAALKHHLEQPFDVVMTRTDPVRMIRVGAHIKREAGVVWLAQFNDPAPQCMYPPPHGPGSAVAITDKVKTELIRRALNGCDAIVSPTLRLAEYVRHTLGMKTKVENVIVPHIGQSCKAVSMEFEENKHCVRILHSGYLSGKRGSTAAINMLKSFFNDMRKGGVEVSLVMTESPSAEQDEFLDSLSEYSQMIEVIPRCPYDESLKQMKNAKALILFEAEYDEGIFLPSKIADYALSGRPVLMFSPERGAVSEIVGGYSHPGFLGQNTAEAAKRLALFVHKAVSCDNLDSYLLPDSDRFIGERIIQRFENDIERLRRIGTGR